MTATDKVVAVIRRYPNLVSLLVRARSCNKAGAAWLILNRRKVVINLAIIQRHKMA